ncbi:protein FAM228A [Centroberyx gerrardi]
MGNLKDGASRASESRRTPSQGGVKMRSSSGGVRAGNRAEAWASGPPQGPQLDWLSHTSLRRLQVEAENQQARAIIQPLLDTENDFLKELESFLSQRDAAELRKRELLHKRWTERVWTPLQKRVEERMSSCCYEEAKRRRSLYSHYIHHCNAKGFVFLESYDPQEYNPFLLNSQKPHYFKLNSSAIKGPLCLQSRERVKEKRTALSCETGRKHTRRQAEQLLQSDLPHLVPLSDSVTPQADLSLLASPHYPVSASSEPLVEVETELRKPNRLNTVPYHITASATPDGRCHQTSCWSFRR